MCTDFIILILPLFRNGFLTEIFFVFLSQLMWFISNRCYGPMISCWKPASLNLPPRHCPTEGQGSNSCIGESLPMGGLTAVFLNKQKQMKERKMMSCIVNIAAQTNQIDEVAVLSQALSLLRHTQCTTELKSHWCFQPW